MGVKLQAAVVAVNGAATVAFVVSGDALASALFGATTGIWGALLIETLTDKRESVTVEELVDLYGPGNEGGELE